MSDIPLCSCGEFYQSHHPQCPARRYADGLQAQLSQLQAENARLRKALIRLRDCDWVVSLPDRMDAVRDIARKALAAEEGEKG
jgi:hypothetical protein